MSDRGAIFLGDLMGFGPSRLDQGHDPAGLTFSDSLTEGHVGLVKETPRAAAVLAHPTLAPTAELVGLAVVIAFLIYMDKRIRITS